MTDRYLLIRDEQQTMEQNVVDIIRLVKSSEPGNCPEVKALLSG